MVVEAMEVGIAEVQEQNCPAYDLLKAITPMSPYFNTYWSQKLESTGEKGKTTRDKKYNIKSNIKIIIEINTNRSL